MMQKKSLYANYLKNKYYGNESDLSLWAKLSAEENNNLRTIEVASQENQKYNNLKRLALLKKVQNFLHIIIYGSDQDWGVLWAEFLCIQEQFYEVKYANGLRILRNCIDFKAKRG